MRRRLLVANLVVTLAVLILLEVPLAVVYSRHEHDALATSLQRDAAAVAALSAEIIENPGQQDIKDLAKRFTLEPGDIVSIVDSAGVELTKPTIASIDPAFRPVMDAARSGTSGSGEIGDDAFVAVPVGDGIDGRGAVLVARSDVSIDHRVRRFWLLLVALGGGVLAVSLLVISRVSRWVVDPLSRLDEQAEALGRGNLSARATTDRGPPEVVALAETFNDMAGRLDELVTSQRRFVADASHQLRTPLTALRLRLESLRPDDPEAIVQTRDAALDEAARLSRLVDGLLALARAEGRRPERERVDAHAILVDRREAWAPLAAEQGVDLRLDESAAHPLHAMLGAGHLEQILDNLIDNALDASPSGSSIDLVNRRTGDQIEIHVIDAGRGMTDVERARAFDPFWQRPGQESAGGSGLGLAIAEQLVRSNQGSISLERSSTGGVDAVVRLPLAPAGG